MSNPHPMQPVIKDDRSVVRFRGNAIIELLVDDLGSYVATDGPHRDELDLDKIAALAVPLEDREQFEQLAGLRSGRANEIVRFIVARARHLVATTPIHLGMLDLNKIRSPIASVDFSQEDREQFAQLMGYPISGYHELSYVSDESAAEASRRADHLVPGAGGCRDHGCPIHGGPLTHEDDNEPDSSEPHEGE